MSDTPNIDTLREEVRKLHSLLAEPEPGIATWNIMYGQRMQFIADWWFYDDGPHQARHELLEASRELIRVIDALREVNVLGDWPVVREALQPIRAAIAKAEQSA